MVASGVVALKVAGSSPGTSQNTTPRPTERTSALMARHWILVIAKYLPGGRSASERLLASLWRRAGGAWAQGGRCEKSGPQSRRARAIVLEPIDPYCRASI